MAVEFELARRCKIGCSATPVPSRHRPRFARSLVFQATDSSFSEFPLRAFIDLLYGLVQLRMGRLDPSAHLILTSDLNLALESLKRELQPHHLQLLQVYNFSVRRSPKRRTCSVASSEQGSPGAKRPRLSSPVASSNHDDDTTPMLNGIGSSSPTPSSISLQMDMPAVTVSMLRALTRDLKKKYIT